MVCSGDMQNPRSRKNIDLMFQQRRIIENSFSVSEVVLFLDLKKHGLNINTQRHPRKFSCQNKKLNLRETQNRCF